MEVRKNLGYMTQAFSLYGELTVRQNLVLHARLYHLPPDKAKRADRGAGRALRPAARTSTRWPRTLPMGLRQRLSLAVAVLHEPQILILDEPTSGVDPVARDSFWELLIDLSRKQGVTIFVTTHFMNEGMRCDRISLMNAGKVLACDAPQKLIDERGAASLEDAFIGYMEDAIAEAAHGGRREQGRERAAPPRRRRRAAAAAAPRTRSRPALRLRARPDARLHAQRDHADPARSGPAGVRVRRLGAADARLRLRHHHRRRAHPLRRRSISISRPRAAPISSSSPARRATSPARRRPAPPTRRSSACSRTTSRWSSRSRRTSAGTSAAAPGRRCWRRSTAP